MALKDFSVQQMISLTKRWLGKYKPNIAGIVELSGAILLLQKAHEGLLLASQPAELAAPDPLKPIQDKQYEHDLGHDRFARGVIRTLLACADFASTPEDSARYLKLLHDLFPSGMDTTSQMYDVESAAVDILESKLSDALKAQLKEIPVLGGESLLVMLSTHITHGKRLGELEDEKDDLKKALEAAPKPELLSVGEARLFWIRATRSFLDLFKFIAVNAETKETLLAPYLKVEAIIERRKKTGQEEPELPEEDEDVPAKD